MSIGHFFIGGVGASEGAVLIGCVGIATFLNKHPEALNTTIYDAVNGPIKAPFGGTLS